MLLFSAGALVLALSRAAGLGADISAIAFDPTLTLRPEARLLMGEGTAKFHDSATWRVSNRL